MSSFGLCEHNICNTQSLSPTAADDASLLMGPGRAGAPDLRLARPDSLPRASTLELEPFDASGEPERGPNELRLQFLEHDDCEHSLSPLYGHDVPLDAMNNGNGAGEAATAAAWCQATAHNRTSAKFLCCLLWGHLPFLHVGIRKKRINGNARDTEFGIERHSFCQARSKQWRICLGGGVARECMALPAPSPRPLVC